MTLSIRSRLTLWYATVAGVIVLVLGLGVYLSASWSLQHVIDSKLTSGIDSITVFLRHKFATHDVNHLGDELREHSSLLPEGNLARISYEGGSVLYQSNGMQDLPSLPPAANGNTSRSDTKLGDRSIRYFSRMIKAGPSFFLIEVGVDQSAYVQMMQHLAWLLSLSIPLAA